MSFSYPSVSGGGGGGGGSIGNYGMLGPFDSNPGMRNDMGKADRQSYYEQCVHTETCISSWLYIYTFVYFKTK